MQIASPAELASKKCLPCEGGVDACPIDHSRAQLASLPAWKLEDDGRSITRKVRFKDFLETIACLNGIADIAEVDGHHPDLHLTGYRILAVELTTHAIDGLSENDFILAAKIDLWIKTEFPDAKAHE